MQLLRFSSLLLVAGMMAASSASATTDLAVSKEAADAIFARTSIDVSDPLARRASPLTSRIVKSSTAAMKRQGNTVVNGDCSQGSPQCCSTTIDKGEDNGEIASLLGVDDIAGAIGINCVNLPVNIIGVAGTFSNVCKSTPVCCQNVTQNGLINLGCNALPIN